MKFKNVLLLILWVLSLLFYGCNQQKSKNAAATEGEMITAKTLGLAYLEENQLEEAEAEFLKLVDFDPTEVLGYANLGIVYLRMGEYQEAEDWLQKAIKMDPKDPDVRLILAKVYEMSNNADKSVKELEMAIQFSPGHVKSLYNLTELYASSTDNESLRKRLRYTEELVKKVPGNIVSRLNLIEILIRGGHTDKSLEQMEKLQQLFPEFPKEAIEYHDKTIAALQVGDGDNAAVSFMIFHNYLKVTSPYQAGILDLKGPGGSLVGSPVITFDQQQDKSQVDDWKTLLEAIKFTDITSSAGLDFLMTGQGRTHLTASDYDGDGDIDLYASHFDPQSQSYKRYLLRNEWGLFKDGSKEAGILHQGIESSAIFADYNNDGFLDLYIVREGSNILYKSTGEGTFVDVSDEAKVGDISEGSSSLFFDFDHDGDLDLFVTRRNSNLLYRNNSDDTFLEQAEKSNLSGGSVVSTDAGFGDFDEDGDIDLFVVNNDASNTLYSNQRQGIFKDVTEGSGLKSEEGSSAVTVGDYNNDGFLDLFVTSLKAGNCRLFRNRGNGSFEVDHTSEELVQTLQSVRAYDASFLDFDNDGFLDLLVVGESNTEGGDGVFLYHNDGTGKLWVVTGILPEDLTSGRDILTFDYNDDGDMDVAVTGMNGSIRLLRNDGGNNNHFVKMKLVGLRTGSAKNNYYGIGAKVEIRSGNLYQSKVVTEPNILFGLGPRTKADVIRILWTNGVPQNIFFPGTDRDLVEEQILKGSCPFLYTWNGEEYIFVKDIMWRSALGMPLGIMGEATAYASPDASVDYIKIPGELLKPYNNKYSIQITDELWETIFLDKIELIVLDHPDSVEVFVDERIIPSSGYQVYQVGEKHIPVSAGNHNSADLLPLIAEKDDRYVSGFKSGKYQGLTEMTDIFLDLGEIDHSKDIHLFLHGWIFPSDASINASISQSAAVEMISPYIQAINEKGEWETIVDNLSFPMGKDKTVIADLSGKIPAFDSRIRIRTNMEIYWDQIFYTNDNPDAPTQFHKLKPSSADLHYRGFSRTYRKGGRYGPHWFDYNHVTTEPKWRDLLGNYTRYGNVLPLLTEADNKYIIKNAGDETTIEFSTEGLPELPEGWKRDFLIHSIGWVKDGDLNTATGQTVWPLPFHGMTCYPYGADESYPSDSEHQEYLREYNTRKVTTENFCRAIIETKR
ncbi:MAG: VCBS repeat-containing protein [Bacteroidales bacterium]|nr:VCBS repeat-containing protein [Bacteroidales bacterium]